MSSENEEHYTDRSGTRGVKQLVVVITQTTFSAPSWAMVFSIADKSVRSSSPSSLFSITTGSNPETKVTVYTHHYDSCLLVIVICLLIYGPRLMCFMSLYGMTIVSYWLLSPSLCISIFCLSLSIYLSLHLPLSFLLSLSPSVSFSDFERSWLWPVAAILFHRWGSCPPQLPPPPWSPSMTMAASTIRSHTFLSWPSSMPFKAEI